MVRASSGAGAARLGWLYWVFQLDVLPIYMALAPELAQAAAGLGAYPPRLAELAERDGHRLYQAVAARALGVASRLAGDVAMSAAHFERATDLLQGLGTRWQLGRTFRERAELARARNDTAAARDFLKRALAEFELLKAMPDLARASELLAQLPPMESGRPRQPNRLKSANQGELQWHLPRTAL